MPEEIQIEQALFAGAKPDSYRILGRSPGFEDEWTTTAEALCAGFGHRPDGIACSDAVFARPFGKHHVAVVQAADLAHDESGRPSLLGFRFLVLPGSAYTDWIADPLLVAERYPAPWHARGDLPSLSWQSEPSPIRPVSEVQTILKRADSPVLLGGVQSLIDGARLVFERRQPDPELVRSLWQLLPASTRGSLWPATFAFDNALGFDVLVVPDASAAVYSDYLTEEQAASYPQGRYELDVQIAAEDGDQSELDRLFRRRSRTETWRLGVFLLVVVLALAIAMKFLLPTPPRPKPAPPAPARSMMKSDFARGLSQVGWVPCHWYPHGLCSKFQPS